jgi:hypothetical protein
VLGHDNGAVRGMESISSALKRMTPELVFSNRNCGKPKVVAWFA